MQDLPLQVREIDNISIDQTESADTGCGKIKSGGRAKPTGADDQDLGLTQLHLALAAHLAEYNLTAVSLNLRVSQFHTALLHDIQFYWVDDDALLPKACDRPFDFRTVPYQF
jgi:hypothetical protein